ncbi:MAG: hypothetical protein HN982_04485 [Candidatus Marinimicrobia bacterium]|nr:hypothetical protein [Candidatus Neomarinimicrobiota bacterium]
MKKTFILLFAMITMIYAKDNPQILRANYFEAKAGKSAQFVKGLKDHTTKFHQTLDHAVNTWEVVAGDRTGQFLRTTYHQGWVDFDEYQDLPGDPSHWERSITPHVKSTSGNVFWKFNAELSHNPPKTPPKMFAFWKVQYKAGGWKKHHDALLKVRQAQKENNSKSQIIVYSKAIGGEGRMYAIGVALDGWADLNPGAMSLYEMLETSFGEGAGNKILQARSEAVEKYESEVLLFRPDLSTPLSK